MTDPVAVEALRALIARWRDEASAMLNSGDLGAGRVAPTLDRCADELDALLSAVRQHTDAELREFIRVMRAELLRRQQERSGEEVSGSRECGRGEGQGAGVSIGCAHNSPIGGSLAMTRTETPCSEGWTSKHPGAGSYSPNPCKRCGWSQEDHSKWESRRDAANEVLIAINNALAPLGLSLARTQNRRGDTFAYSVLALPTAAVDPSADNTGKPRSPLSDERLMTVAHQQIGWIASKLDVSLEAGRLALLSVLMGLRDEMSPPDPRVTRKKG